MTDNGTATAFPCRCRVRFNYVRLPHRDTRESSERLPHRLERPVSGAGRKNDRDADQGMRSGDRFTTRDRDACL